MKEVSDIVDVNRNGIFFCTGNFSRGDAYFGEKVEKGNDVDLKVGGHEIHIKGIEPVEGGKWHGEIAWINPYVEEIKGLMVDQDIAFAEANIRACYQA